MSTYAKLEAAEAELIRQENAMPDDDPDRDAILHDIAVVQAMMMGCPEEATDGTMEVV